jgi:hypothetical protein
MENIASRPSTSHGIARSVTPNDWRALLRSPTLSLKMYLNMKPTRMGENIIGNIMIVRSVRCPKLTRAIRRAMPSPKSISRLSAMVRNRIVRPKATQKSQSPKRRT